MITSGVVTAEEQCNIIATIKTLYNKNWVVYAKKPFGGPEQVIDYLSRYTHKVAITNNRIKAVDGYNQSVTFDYKDYASNGIQKQMQLGAKEFIRRFEQHILPKYFTKIRSYGYLSNRNRQTNITAIVQFMQLPAHPIKIIIPWQVRLQERFRIAYNQCAHCNELTLLLVGTSYKNEVIKDG